MGLFSKLFGKRDKKEKEDSNDEAIYYVEHDEQIKAAMLEAQQNFKYFWRELYWEYRRIVPAHDFAMIKIPFTQRIKGQTEAHVEHMWINNIDFDGDSVTGDLVNDPNQLTNISKGDSISKKIDEIGDWMFSIGGQTYGGFTIQAMRARMNNSDRENHDTAWGLDFGDSADILLAYQQKENPENLIEHPMSINMAEKMRDFLAENPKELTAKDNRGLSLLHKETIAGNRTSIEILLELGAGKSMLSNSNKTALDYAKAMNWDHLGDLLN